MVCESEALGCISESGNASSRDDDHQVQSMLRRGALPDRLSATGCTLHPRAHTAPQSMVPVGVPPIAIAESSG